MDDESYPLTLHYESACPLCNAEMTSLGLRNTEGRLHFVDMATTGFDEPPPGTTVADLLAAMHGPRADGRVILGWTFLGVFLTVAIIARNIWAQVRQTPIASRTPATTTGPDPMRTIVSGPPVAS